MDPVKDFIQLYYEDVAVILGNKILSFLNIIVFRDSIFSF